ncbi:MAG: FadR/GntR family transcriptional regulator [Desulfatirhabdiaceae bacterium]
MNKEQTSELAGSLKTIRRVKVYEEISRQIEELIQSGKLKPGDKLPTERELSEIFNVSRHSVREAIRVLENNQLINSVAGSGTYVALRENQESINSIVNYLLEETDKFSEILELRRIIEPQIAGLAAKNATVDDIDRLKSMQIKNDELIANGIVNHNDFSQFDTHLHTTIAKATQNNFVSKIIERLNDFFYVTRLEGYQSEIRIKTSARGHAEIIQAILQGDCQMAIHAMENHLKDVEDTTIQHLVTLSLNKTKKKEHGQKS